MTRFASVILDVDSTLVSIEGIDWLAGLRDDAVRRRIADATDAAMRGDITLDAVYGERLALIRPTRAEVERLGDAYIAALQPDAAETIRTLQALGVRVVLLTGGIQQAVAAVAAHVGIAPADVHAVPVSFDAGGGYAGYDTTSLLARAGGKPHVAASLHLPTPVVAVGDGVTDAEIRSVTGAFIAFVGTVVRDRVVASADASIARLGELIDHVTGTPARRNPASGTTAE